MLAKTFPDGLKYEDEVDNNNDEQVDINNEENAKTFPDEEDVENNLRKKLTTTMRKNRV